MPDLNDAVVGCLLGTAVGDALGLPREGLRPERARRLFGDPVRHAFVLGRGMVSDDTEHALMAAEALLEHRDDPDAFARGLAWRLRWWLLGLPAGVGLATLRSCIRLWLGRPPDRSGVYSAGNGPLMRAPIIGVVFANDPARMARFVRASTRLTHTDPRAERAAMAVALAASFGRRFPCSQITPGAIARDLSDHLPETDGELAGCLEAVAAGEIGDRFAGGVSGYCYHTLTAVLHVWAQQPRDVRAALSAVIALGGDTDTTGAILGGIMGANLGVDALPADWRRAIMEWPRSVAWIGSLGAALGGSLAGRPTSCPRLAWWAIPLRNALFAILVIGHGLRRLLP